MRDLVIESTTTEIMTSTVIIITLIGIDIDIDTVKNTLAATVDHTGKPKLGSNDETHLLYQDGVGMIFQTSSRTSATTESFDKPDENSLSQPAR